MTPLIATLVFLLGVLLGAVAILALVERRAMKREQGYWQRDSEEGDQA